MKKGSNPPSQAIAASAVRLGELRLLVIAEQPRADRRDTRRERDRQLRRQCHHLIRLQQSSGLLAPVVVAGRRRADTLAGLLPVARAVGIAVTRAAGGDYDRLLAQAIAHIIRGPVVIHAEEHLSGIAEERLFLSVGETFFELADALIIKL